MSLRDVFNRYGPMLALILTLVVLVAVLPSSNSKDEEQAGDGGYLATGPGGAAQAGGQQSADGGTDLGGGELTTGSDGATGGAATGEGSAGGAWGGLAGAADPVAAATGAVTGEHCRPDGLQWGISRGMPPCLGFDGNNFGATDTGVTADAVKVAYYVPRPNAATEAALKAAGVQDDQADVDRIIEVYRRYYNAHYETYGREVQFVKVNGGAPEDDVAMKADANKIADAGFFAAFNARGVVASSTFNRTLAQRGVICLFCTNSEAESFYEATRDHNFGAWPKLREYYEHIGEYMAKRLIGKGRTAKHAGAPATPADVDLREQPRKFGLIWINAYQGTVNPGAQEERDYFIKEILPRYGIKGVVDANYNYDAAQGPTTAQTIIAKMNTEHVTTIILIADPIMPIYFTREATKQAYFPEWFLTGTLLTDTTFFGRTYDQGQWAHAYGTSPLWVFWEHLPVSDGYREYHHMCPFVQPAGECERGKEGIGVNTYRAGPAFLFSGIHMAGPQLTSESFAQGLYNAPPVGGNPSFPLVKFTAESPTAIKDFTEVWWDANSRGKDEVEKDGQGILVKAAGGQRYLMGQWPTDDPYAFNPEGSIFTSDEYYTAPDAPQHEQDGHTHDGNQRCLSCR